MGTRSAKSATAFPLLLKVFLLVIAITWLQLVWIVRRVEVHRDNGRESEAIRVGVDAVASLNQRANQQVMNDDPIARIKKVEPPPPPHQTDHGSTPATRRCKIPLNPDLSVAHHLSFAWRHHQNPSHEIATDDAPEELSVLRNLKENCSTTSQVELFISKNGSWTLQSFDSNGNPKSDGGDEFYVTYHAAYEATHARPELVLPDSLSFLKKRAVPLAVAHVTDNGNGTYSLDFVQSPFSTAAADAIPGNLKNHVSIYLDYTCGVSKIPQPKKQIWFTGGALMMDWTIENVTEVPPIRAFQPPNQDGRIDLGKYDQILCYGDSNVRNIVRYLSTTPNNNLHMIGEPQAALQEASLNRKFLPRTKDAVEAALRAHNDTTVPPKLAVLIGSNTWDIVFGVKHGATYTSHLKACRQWVEEMRRAFPTVDVYWFPGYALHAHVVGLKQPDSWPEIKPLKYMSYYRSWQLYRWQRDLMTDLNVPMIDAFEASFLSAEKTVTGDARHYVNPFVVRSTSWFYANSTKT